MQVNVTMAELYTGFGDEKNASECKILMVDHAVTKVVVR